MQVTLLLLIAASIQLSEANTQATQKWNSESINHIYAYEARNLQNLTETLSPTNSPTFSPSNTPTASPTFNPTEKPTTSPTFIPTEKPTISPTFIPTEKPTTSPTFIPTESPTINPTKKPTTSPTFNPTRKPTVSPSKNPTTSPTFNPTREPTVSPTRNPTKFPTVDTFIYRNNNYIRLIYIPILLLMCSFTIIFLILRRRQWKEADKVVILKKEIKRPKGKDSNITEEVNEDDVDLNLLELSGSSSHKERRVLPSKQEAILTSKRIKAPKMPKLNLRNIKLPKFRRPGSDIEVVRSDELPRSSTRRPSGLFVRMSYKRGGLDYEKERADSFTSQRKGSFFSRFSFSRNDRNTSLVLPSGNPRRTVTFDNATMRKKRSSRTFDQIEEDSLSNSETQTQLDDIDE